MEGADCELHPLIHTRLVFNLAQNDDSSQVRAIEKRKPLDTGEVPANQLLQADMVFGRKTYGDLRDLCSKLTRKN